MGKNLVENLVVEYIQLLMMTASLRIIISLYLDTVSEFNPIIPGWIFSFFQLKFQLMVKLNSLRKY